MYMAIYIAVAEGEVVMTRAGEIFAALLMLPMLAPAAAAEEAAACPATPAPLPAELASWPKQAVAGAAIDAGGLKQAALTPGRTVNAQLSPTASLRWPVAPQKPGDPGSFGGLFRFTAKQAGTYRVALGAGAWVEVAREGKALTSTAHGHGPACSAIRKIVDFKLVPGDYLLEIAGSAKPEIAVLVTRKP